MDLKKTCVFQRVAESQTTLTEEEEAAEDVGGSQQEDRAHLVTQVRQPTLPSLPIQTTVTLVPVVLQGRCTNTHMHIHFLGDFR